MNPDFMHKNYIRYSALASFLFLLSACGGNDGTKVAVEEVQKRTITETVSASGKIQPEVEVKISSDVSGEIIELNVKEGDQVKQGDLLLRIRADIYQSNLKQTAAALNQTRAAQASAQARLSQMEAQYAGTEASFLRTQKLHDQGVVSDSEYETAKAEYGSMRAQVNAARQEVQGARYNVNAAQARMKESSDNLSRTTIFAPVDGTVSTLNVEAGERVVGTSQMAGTELMRISNLSDMEVSVVVNENDITRISLDDTAIIDVDAYMGKKFKGIVTEISSSANYIGTASEQVSNVDQVTNFDVKVRILPGSYDQLDQKKPFPSPFRPGMSAAVEIQTEKVKNALSVPIQAVTIRDESSRKSRFSTSDENEEAKEGEGANKAETKSGTKSKSGEDKESVNEVVFVFNKAKGTVEKRIVTTGVQDNLNIEILSGLKAGESVVVAPYVAISKDLKDGAKVEQVDRSDIFEVEEK